MADTAKQKRPNKGILEDGFLTLWSEKKRDAMQKLVRLLPEPALKVIYKMSLGQPKMMLGGLTFLIKHFTNLPDFGDDLIDDAAAEIAIYLEEIYGDGKVDGNKAEGKEKKKFETPKDSITIRRAIATADNTLRGGFMERLNRFLGNEEIRKNRLLDYCGSAREISGWIKVLGETDDRYIYDFYVEMLIGPPAKPKPIVWVEIAKYKNLKTYLGLLEIEDEGTGKNKVKALLYHLSALMTGDLAALLRNLNQGGERDFFQAANLIYEKSSEKTTDVPKVLWKFGKRIRQENPAKAATFIVGLGQAFKAGKTAAR
jgi:hypothetical protein